MHYIAFPDFFLTFVIVSAIFLW